MDKKTILITGAANGIGEAAARLFLKNGWYVGLADIDESKLKILSDEFGADKCCYTLCDVSDEASVKAAIKYFSEQTMGRLDVLLSNAGIIYQGPFETHTPEQYKRMLNVNAFGCVNMVYGALEMLKNTKNSRIIITSSSSAMFGIPTFAVYAATKAFLKSMTEALSMEFSKKYNIQISSIMPLFVQTKMMNNINDKHKAYLTPEYVAMVMYNAATTGKKRHYLIGKNLCLMNFLIRILPTKLCEKVMKWYLKE